MRVFVDASVLFSAVFSPSGYARDLLQLAGQDALTLVVSQDILDETERNLQKKSPAKLPLFTTFIAVLEPEIVEDPTPEEVAAAAAYTVQKDAPIVAAAIKAHVDYLVTFDHKDLLDPPPGRRAVRPHHRPARSGDPAVGALARCGIRYSYSHTLIFCLRVQVLLRL